MAGRWRCLVTVTLFLVVGVAPLYPQADSSPRQVGAGRPTPRADSAPKDPYQLRISGYYEDGQNTFIQLSNGTVWRHRRPNLFRQGWLVGDEIELAGRVDDEWIMRNDTYKGTVAVTFEKGVGDALPTLAKNERSGAELYLDDGSVWRVEGWNRLWSGVFTWQRGDRIIVAPLALPVGSYTHLLINIDKGMEDTNAIILQR